MDNNRLYLYTTEITPSRNLLVDHIEDYLSTLTSLYTVTTMGKLKVDLDLTIRLDMTQDTANGVLTGNANYIKYVDINSNDSETIYYFFILSVKVVSSHTVLFELSLDTINTFNGKYVFSKKTQILRQMRDRFYQPEHTQILDFTNNATNSGVTILGEGSNVYLSGTATTDIVYTLKVIDIPKGTYYFDLPKVSGMFDYFPITNSAKVSSNGITMTILNGNVNLEGTLKVLTYSSSDAFTLSAGTYTFNASSDNDYISAYLNISGSSTKVRPAETFTITANRTYDLRTQYSIDVLGTYINSNISITITRKDDTKFLEVTADEDNTSGYRTFTDTEQMTYRLLIPSGMVLGDTPTAYNITTTKALPQGEAFNLFRKIDRQPEGVEVEKYIDSNEMLLDSSPLTTPIWYLIWQTNDELDVDNLNNPVSCYLLSNVDVPCKYTGTASTSINFLTIMNSSFTIFTGDYILFNEYGGQVIVNWGSTSKTITLGSTTIVTGTSYLGKTALGSGTIHSIKLSKTFDIQLKMSFLDSSGTELWISDSEAWSSSYATWTFYNSTYYIYHTAMGGDKKIYLLTSNTTETKYVTMYQLNKQATWLTDSKTMKVIQLPYAPTTPVFDAPTDTYIFNSFPLSLVKGALKSSKTTPSLARANVTSFNMNEELLCLIPATRLGIPKNNYYESKFYSVELYNFKVVYDSFEKLIPLELIAPLDAGAIYETDDTFTTSISMKVTNSVNSTFVFKLQSSDVDIVWQHLYDEYLLVKRNNEVPIYTSSYIDYIKNGYNYDVKSNTLQQQQQWTSTGINIVGATAGAISSALTGNLISGAGAISMGASAINSISANIMSKTKADNLMASKLSTLKDQASNVSGSDDLDLFTYYNGYNDKLRVTKSVPRDEVKNAIADLFYYTGYACSFQGIPNTNSRLYFDYIQVSPDFENDGKYIYNDYIEDIKARYQVGVTIMHEVDGEYNWAQDYENWEIWLTY